MKLIIKTQKFNKNLFIKNFLIFLIKKFLLITEPTASIPTIPTFPQRFSKPSTST